MTVHLAQLGCCPGCRYCYGMAINCHRKKCRCGNPDQCPECNLTQPEDGHREYCEIGYQQEAQTDNLRDAIARATATSDPEEEVDAASNGEASVGLVSSRNTPQGIEAWEPDANTAASSSVEPTPHCAEPGCEKTLLDGPLHRVNPKGTPGIFMCVTHAQAVNSWESRLDTGDYP